MFSIDDPIYIPIVLPNDAAALEAAPPWATVMISAVYSSNPRLAKLCRLVRNRALMVLVDPKTPHFQFEGYMSMPDYRALAYSPGRHTLGTLWEPTTFTRPGTRQKLIASVFETQRELEADALLAPYFYVRHVRHPWLEVTRDCAREAIEASPDTPVGVVVCVDIDAILDAEHRQEIGAVFASLEASFYWLVVVNYDEMRADPRDTAALLSFAASLQETGRPLIHAYAGRSGLMSVANGAAGYAAGTHGFETHPRQFFREMMGTRPANSYYLHECMLRLPVRTAEAVLTAADPVLHPTCDCAACGHTAKTSLMVSRRLALHALLRRAAEIDWLGAIPVADRNAALVDRLTAALDKSAEIAAAPEHAGGPEIEPGEYHYLEGLREACGGEAASIPIDDGFG